MCGGREFIRDKKVGLSEGGLYARGLIGGEIRYLKSRPILYVALVTSQGKNVFGRLR